MAISSRPLVHNIPRQESCTKDHVTIPEENLIERSKQGDRQAYSALAAKYYTMIYATALSILRNPEDAEDTCQDAMIKAFRHIHSIRDQQKFAPWLRSIVRQEAYARYRKQSRFFDVLKEFVVEKKHQAETVEPNQDRHLYHAQLFQSALESLSEKAREIVLLHYMNGMSCKEIADQIHVREGTVKSHLFKARNKMIQRFSQMGIHSIDDL